LTPRALVADTPLRVLVVDDSAIARQVLSRVLTLDGMEVRAASDPILALSRMRTFVPDVIVLDLEMPRMDGLTFLRVLRASRPTPVVICSGVAGARSVLAMRALEEGAAEIVARPRVGLREFFDEARTLLTDAVRAAAQARPQAPPAAPEPLRAFAARAPLGPDEPRVLALGASTGGTEALYQLLSALPADTPGTVIVQHMPEGFTAAFAARLHAGSAMRVKEAEPGDAIVPGVALVAPGGRHLRVRRGHGGLIADVQKGPLVQRHRPSVDVLFMSVAEAAGADAVAAILTGMGDDGCAGMRALRAAGASTLAQDEATSVVFGMPRAAILAGVIDEVVPLGRMAAAIRRRLAGRVVRAPGA
jgi:two-component system chemotaxis response regulator CheB